ncbi:hypothetical protein GJ496_001949 [Pomphorhynchus laevis]|nr:hypothetical protein GJ496_001949 [Pomphorhynchus laevis]
MHNPNQQESVNPNYAQIQTDKIKRGFKKCDRCFTHSNVKCRNCKNCNSAFPVIRQPKSEYEVCELIGVAEHMRLFSVCKTLTGLPFRGFVCYDCEASGWTCFFCSNSNTIYEQLSSKGLCKNFNKQMIDHVEEVNKEDVKQSSLVSHTSTSSDQCFHIMKCKTCDQTAKALEIKRELIDAVIQDSNVHWLCNRIEQKINLLCPAIFQTSFRTFAVCCLPEDFTAGSDKPEKHIGYLHTHLFENTRYPNRCSTSRKLRFRCQCGFFKSHSGLQVKLNTELIRCAHYYLTLAAIYSNPELNAFYSQFDLKTGKLVTDDETTRSLKIKCSTMPPQLSLKLGVEQIKNKNIVNEDSFRNCPKWYFNDWLKSIGERINETMYPKNYGRIQNLKFHSSLNFIFMLQDKLEGSVKAQIRQLNIHPSIQKAGIFCEHTWTFLTYESLKQVFDIVEAIRFYEVVNNRYVSRKDNLDYGVLEGRLVRCTIDFNNPLCIKWIENINETNLFGELHFIFSIRRDLLGKTLEARITEWKSVNYAALYHQANYLQTRLRSREIPLVKDPTQLIPNLVKQELSVTDSGITLLDSLVGDDIYTKSKFEELIVDWFHLVRMIGPIAVNDGHSAYALYTNVVKHKWAYIQRACENAFILFNQLRDVIFNETVLSMLDLDKLNEVLIKCISLPVRMGGICIFDPVPGSIILHNQSLRLCDPF